MKSTCAVVFIIYVAETVEYRKDLFRLKIKEFLIKAEKIKETLSKESNSAVQPSVEDVEKPTIIADDSVSCTVVFNIEGVQCWSSFGSENELIASGECNSLSLTH